MRPGSVAGQALEFVFPGCEVVLQKHTGKTTIIHNYNYLFVHSSTLSIAVVLILTFFMARMTNTASGLKKAHKKETAIVLHLFNNVTNCR